ncbi:MAG: FtsX-like permease family protein [Candidatus Thorarchaeota archaeon]
MVISVGLKLIHGNQRKIVTLLCVILASAPIMGISVYVDSFTFHDWNRFIDIGPVPITIRGRDTFLLVSTIDTIPVLTNTCSMLHGSRHIKPYADNFSGASWQKFVSPAPDYFDVFPEVFTFYAGRNVANESEIALSRNLATELGVGLGDLIYTQGGYEIWFNVTIVGLYDKYVFHLADELATDIQEINWGDAIVTTGLLIRYHSLSLEIHADFDKSPISPFDTDASLHYLNSINAEIESLSGLDTSSSVIYVNNYLAIATSEYASWVDNYRIIQIQRTTGLILLAGFVILMAIRFNLREKKQETDMLLMRGAEKLSIFLSLFKEILVVGIIGCFTGFVVGILMSRIALMATELFSFNLHLFLSEPFFISMDSVIISLIIGILTPLIAFGFSVSLDAIKQPIDTKSGRLGRLSKRAGYLKWDVLFIFGTIVLLIGILFSGIRLIQNTPLSPILALAPFALILGIASLFVKGMSRGAVYLSRVFSPLIGKIPSNVGIRKIGRNASSTAPTIIVIVLAMSLACNHTILGASIVSTKEYQARFAFGADAKIQLNAANRSSWDDFVEIAKKHTSTKAVTTLSLGSIYLSSGIADEIDFVAIDPNGYRKVGYNHLGYPLDQTSMNDSLTEMMINPTGVIITSDVALEYGVGRGDALRARVLSASEEETLSFQVIQVVEALSPCRFYDTGTTDSPGWWSTNVGQRVIWANRNYLNLEFNFTFRQTSLVCIRTVDGENSTKMVEDVLADAPSNTYYEGAWISKDIELDTLTQESVYRMDRAVDTIVTVALLFVVVGSLTTFSAEHLAMRRKEVALLKALGATRRQVVVTQSSEVIIITFFSLGLLAFYAPLLTFIHTITTSTSSYIYSINMFLIIPLGFILNIVSIFVFLIASFVIATAMLSSRVDIPTALRDVWAEGGMS